MTASGSALRDVSSGGIHLTGVRIQRNGWSVSRVPFKHVCTARTPDAPRERESARSEIQQQCLDFKNCQNCCDSSQNRLRSSHELPTTRVNTILLKSSLSQRTISCSPRIDKSAGSTSSKPILKDHTVTSGSEMPATALCGGAMAQKAQPCLYSILT